MQAPNPFTVHGRITATERFVGRWRELSVVFDRLETGRPVLIGGVPGIGKSSLLTHIAQSAAVNLERPDLVTFYIDMGKLASDAELYELLARAIHSRGSTLAALEVALLQIEEPLLLCLDRCEVAVAAGWGAAVLDQLARLSRRSIAPPISSIPNFAGAPPFTPAELPGDHMLLLVGVLSGTAELEEPFVRLSLGGFAPAEVRLLTDAYLDHTGVYFSPDDLRELSTLSLNHPAYLQRAAYHLYITRSGQQDYDWRTAYMNEAQDRPVPGAPLPPEVFSGEVRQFSWSSFEGDYRSRQRYSEPPQIDDLGDLLRLLVPAIGGLVVWQAAANPLLGGLVAVLLGAALWLYSRVRRTT